MTPRSYWTAAIAFALSGPAAAAAAQARAPLRPPVDTVRGRVDTVRVVERDTVRVVQRDTLVVERLSFGNAAVSGVLQVQLTGGDSALRSTYRIRRAEVRVISDLGKHAQAVMMIDVAKTLTLRADTVSQATRVLQDAYLVVPVRRMQIEAGQQRLPLGYEGSMGSSNLETIDRALFESDRARGGGLGDVRDLGVAVRGSVRALDYKIGVFNGSGESMNETDRNVGKALVGQMSLEPSFLRGLRIGISGATSGAGTGDKPARDRFGADLVLKRGRTMLQSEVMTGRDDSTLRRGLYALGTYTFLPGMKLVGRFDTFDPDIRAEATPADVIERDYLAGLNWVPASTRLELHVAVVHKTYTNRIAPTATQLVSQLQATW
jgi:hypothetical protein